jgi:hypothetical protein
MKKNLVALLLFVAFVNDACLGGTLASEIEPGSAESHSSCNLSPIKRPPVDGTINLQPNSPTAYELRRSVSMQLKTTPDASKTKYIQFDETGELALAPNSLSGMVTTAVGKMRSRAGETCQFSISTFSGSANWAIPPTVTVKADGKGRKCTSFSYPCGLPTVHCDTVLGVPVNCYPEQPMCLATQATDIANWSMSVSGVLPIKVGDDGKSFDVNVVRGQPVSDTGGSGEVAQILDSVGLLKVFANIDTSLKTNVSFDSIPTVGRLLSVIAPIDVVASSKVQSVKWLSVGNTGSGKFSSVGISYTQSFALKLKPGCLVAKCLRTSANDVELAKCVLGP